MQEWKASEKEAQKMTRDGAISVNLVTGETTMFQTAPRSKTIPLLMRPPVCEPGGRRGRRLCGTAPGEKGAAQAARHLPGG